MKNVDDPHNYTNEYYAIYYYPKSSIVPSQAMKVTITTSMPANQTYSWMESGCMCC